MSPSRVARSTKPSRTAFVRSAARTRATSSACSNGFTRELEPSLRERYFREDGERLIAGERLRGFVHFAQHNLTRDPVPPLGEAPFDLILCRNVLIGVAKAAGASGSDEVISHTARLLADDPLNASAHFLHGLAELEAGDAEAAVAALRRAL